MSRGFPLAAMGRGLASLAAAFFAFSGQPTAAQPQPEPPSAVRAIDAPAGKAPAANGLTISGGVRQLPCPFRGEGRQGEVISLAGVGFDLPGDVDPALLQPAFARDVGRAVPLETLCDIRDSAAAILAREGYFADVRIPAQDLAGGNVRMEVVFGRLVAIRVRGSASVPEGRIAEILQPLNGRILNLRAVERQLDLIDALPGYDVSVSLRSFAGGAEGDLTAVVTVRRKRIEGVAAVNNLDDAYTAVGLARIDANGLLGDTSQTSLGVIASGDLESERGFLLGQQVRIGGALASARVTRVVAKSDVVDLRTESWFATALGEVPLRLTRFGDLRLQVGLDLFNFDASFDGIALLRDRLRVGFARAKWRSGSPDDRLEASGAVELRKGLSILGASRSCSTFECLLEGGVPPSRIEGVPTATVLRGSGAVRWRPAPMLSVALAASGQYTGSPLLADEEFVGGNFGIGRGFGSSALRGDRAIAAQVEVEYGRPSGETPLALRGFWFLDAVKVHNLDRIFVSSNERPAISSGAELRMVMFKRIGVEVFGAWPWTRGPFGETPKFRLMGTTSYVF